MSRFSLSKLLWLQGHVLKVVDAVKYLNIIYLNDAFFSEWYVAAILAPELHGLY